MHFRNFQRNINWTVDMNMQMSELMMPLPHNFPFILFTKMTKIPYFSYEKVKLALYPLWINAECLLWYILIRGNAFGTTCLRGENENFQHFMYRIHVKLWGDDINSLTCIYSYRQFKKRFVEITKFKISYLPYISSNLHQIFTVLFEIVLLFLLN